jgi:peptide/nickel transport system permease protein
VPCHWRDLCRCLTGAKLHAPLVVRSMLSMAAAVLAEAELSFLGLGGQPPTPAWRQMLSTTQRYLSLVPWLAYWPGLAIFLVVMGFNLIGDKVREALDPHVKTERPQRSSHAD